MKKNLKFPVGFCIYNYMIIYLFLENVALKRLYTITYYVDYNVYIQEIETTSLIPTNQP